MDWLATINTAVGLASLIFGGFAIWLSLHLYTKAKDAERETTNALAAIKAQSEALQRLTGRWMDRFTRHATEPRPADEGLMQLVHVVASLPTTILAHLDVVRAPAQSNVPPQLIRELTDAYVGLYYYTALSNVLAQSLLPTEDIYNPQDSLHSGVSALVDRTAADFQHMANVMGGLDQSLVANSSLKRLLDEALNQWRPHVRYASQVFELRRGTVGENAA